MGKYSREANFRKALPLVTELVWPTFNVVLLVVVIFISDTCLRPLVNYYLFAMSFFACGYVIVLGFFGFCLIIFGCIFSIWIEFVLRV